MFNSSGKYVLRANKVFTNFTYKQQLSEKQLLQLTLNLGSFLSQNSKDLMTKLIQGFRGSNNDPFKRIYILLPFKLKNLITTVIMTG
jgi:hypothetical protein